MCDKDYNEEFMQEAVRLSIENIERGGGPFGAVIVRDGKIISRGANSVTLDNDPTAHAEVNAIRNACRSLGTFQLGGCIVFSSCEPCPMCLGAIYWAHLDKIYYANDRVDAAAIGFDDEFIYREFDLKPADRHKPMVPLLREEGKKAFAMWAQSDSKTEY